MSVTVEDDSEPHATNLCKVCYIVRQSEREEPSANNRTWTTLVAEKRSRGKLAVCLGARGLEQQNPGYLRGRKDRRATVSLTKEWPETSTYKEEFALLRKRKAWAAEQDGATRDQSGREGRLVRTRRRAEVNRWMMVKLKERHYEAKQDDDQRRNAVQQIMHKSTDFLRRIVVPVEGLGGVTLSYVCA